MRGPTALLPNPRDSPKGPGKATVRKGTVRKARRPIRGLGVLPVQEERVCSTAQ